MDKKNFTKLTVIAYCQRCNKSSHADIEEISKYNESIASMIEKHTELDNRLIFGNKYLVCQNCASEYSAIVDKRKQQEISFLS